MIKRKKPKEKSHRKRPLCHVDIFEIILLFAFTIYSSPKPKKGKVIDCIKILFYHLQKKNTVLQKVV